MTPICPVLIPTAYLLTKYREVNFVSWGFMEPFYRRSPLYKWTSTTNNQRCQYRSGSGRGRCAGVCIPGQRHCMNCSVQRKIQRVKARRQQIQYGRRVNDETL